MVAFTTLLIAGLTASMSNAQNLPRAAMSPTITQLTPDELSQWAVNGTQVLEPPAFGPEVEKRVVIGTDDRYSRASKDFPWAAIGRLKVVHADGGWSTYSGALVGPRTIVTSRSALADNTQYYQFSPGYNHGDVFPSAYVTSGIALTKDTVNWSCDLLNGWAVLTLDQPLGTQQGFFKIGDYFADESIISNKNVMYAAGYTQDRDNMESLFQSDFRTTALTEKARCSGAGPITGDVDVGNENGGPIWRLDGSTRVLYGTIEGSVVSGSSGRSVHAGGPQLFQAVNQLNSENPK